MSCFANCAARLVGASFQSSTSHSCYSAAALFKDQRPFCSYAFVLSSTTQRGLPLGTVYWRIVNLRIMFGFLSWIRAHGLLSLSSPIFNGKLQGCIILLQRPLRKCRTFIVFWMSVATGSLWLNGKRPTLVGTLFGLFLNWPVTWPHDVLRRIWSERVRSWYGNSQPSRCSVLQAMGLDKYPQVFLTLPFCILHGTPCLDYPTSRG